MDARHSLFVRVHDGNKDELASVRHRREVAQRPGSATPRQLYPECNRGATAGFTASGLLAFLHLT